jgi:hypothetical protein
MLIDANAGAEVFERILTAPSALVVLDIDDEDGVIEQFRMIARRSGQSVYQWSTADGLTSLRDAQARVPGCQRLGDALRYIQQSLHFGVYLLAMPVVEPNLADIALLRQLARITTEHVRRIVLVGAQEATIAALEDSAVRMGGHLNSKRVQPRLRDGRWVT